MAYHLKYSDYPGSAGPPNPASWIGPPGPQGVPGQQGPQGVPGGLNNVLTLPAARPDGSPPVGAVSGTLYSNGGFVCIAP
jgi:hypothetical protein